jgi:hypothetical protein
MNRYIAIILIIIPFVINTYTDSYKILCSVYMILLGLLFYILKVTFFKLNFKKWTIYNLQALPSLLLLILTSYMYLTKSKIDYYFLISAMIFTFSLVRIERNENEVYD